MPDFSMCTGDKCPLKKTCYRYLAKPSEYQSYFSNSPVTPDGSCDYYGKASKVVKQKIVDNVKAGVYSDWSRQAAKKVKPKKKASKR